jgi:hypothetical protein
LDGIVYPVDVGDVLKVYTSIFTAPSPATHRLLPGSIERHWTEFAHSPEPAPPASVVYPATVPVIRYFTINTLEFPEFVGRVKLEDVGDVPKVYMVDPVAPVYDPPRYMLLCASVVIDSI